MLWTTVDPATTTGLGLCRWDGRNIIGTTKLVPAKARALKKHPELTAGVAITDGSAVWASWADAIHAFVWGVGHVVCEETFGESKATVAKLAHLRGRIEQECNRQGVPYTEVNVSTWRKVIGDEVGLVYPNKTADAKARSIELAKRHYDLDVDDNQAEAALIGRWALMTWTVRP